MKSFAILNHLDIPMSIETKVWDRFDNNVNHCMATGGYGPDWATVIARVTIDDSKDKVLWIDRNAKASDFQIHRSLPYKVSVLRTILVYQVSGGSPNSPTTDQFLC